jgi:hypothetical protein
MREIIKVVLTQSIKVPFDNFGFLNIHQLLNFFIKAWYVHSNMQQ